jgi:tetratricopeptide (TPR) repeat protein
MKEKTAAKVSAKKTSKTKMPHPPPVPEDLLREFVSLFGGEGMSAGDIQALSTSLMSASAGDARSDEENDAKFEAQELAFAAMEAHTNAEARKLAKRALKLDPDCVDALVLLADLDAPSRAAHIEALQAAVAAGERSLGKKFMRENEGRFWLMLDTRPYMRALDTLGGELAGAGMSRDAIAVYEKMLAHNPNDNQGVRDPLLGLYLQVDDLDGAGRLLKQYKNDGSAAHIWGALLERLLAGDYTAAEKALKLGLKANRFVAERLTKNFNQREPLPEMYERGSVEEAILCKSWLGMAWRVHPEARDWVEERLKAPKAAPAEKKAKKMPKTRVQ